MTLPPPTDLHVMGIGELSLTLGLTPRAIRLYDGMGLVGAQRDRFNRRVYNAEACADLKLIALLRAAGVPLEDVQRILQVGRVRGAQARRSAALATIAARRETLSEQAIRLQAAEAWFLDTAGPAMPGMGPRAAADAASA
ncbi:MULTISPECIES: MerR family transcriptional regulator [unclassified Phenylobacterium]|uniref:MerR family transcriptional regulator n=1 Tax=unclassified Phenylobacterium TaxID=2640670 RepID=UPI00083A053B|nr:MULTISPECIES: MerR family transcriptional regulator [unclassified Phenylobacterium]